jgi:hypothetical protein
VADSFAELDGFGTMAVEETGLDEAFADCDDNVWVLRPALVTFA